MAANVIAREFSLSLVLTVSPGLSADCPVSLHWRLSPPPTTNLRIIITSSPVNLEIKKKQN